WVELNPAWCDRAARVEQVDGPGGGRARVVERGPDGGASPEHRERGAEQGRGRGSRRTDRHGTARLEQIRRPRVLGPGIVERRTHERAPAQEPERGTEPVAGARGGADEGDGRRSWISREDVYLSRRDALPRGTDQDQVAESRDGVPERLSR